MKVIFRTPLSKNDFLLLGSLTTAGFSFLFSFSEFIVNQKIQKVYFYAGSEFEHYFFDEKKREALTAQLLDAIDDPDVTTEQLLEVDIQADHHSAIRRLQTAMYHSGYKVKVSEFFDRIDMDRFVIWSASHFLSEGLTVIPTPIEKEKLAEITANILRDWSFENSVIYHADGFTLKPLTAELLSVIQYLDYPLDEATFLDLTELPAYIFDKNKDETKYVYLRRKLPADKLNLRLSRNIAEQCVKSMALKDHIDYFDRCKDASIAEYALGMCKDSSDTYLRSIAWRYLYNTLGADYVASEILPIADEELLLEISGACKDVSREKLCKSMEREYKKTPSIQLQAHLITYGSSLAFGDYVKKVISSKKTPEGKGIHIDGSTAAISSICDPEFLPQLEMLLITAFDPEFEDNTWHSLRNSLTKAFVNCGAVAYEKTIEVITRNRPSADIHEGNYRYCNYTIEEIAYARKTAFDIPKTLLEAKEFLDKVRKYY